jgi:NADH-dependent peroxiredoxin subunit F
VAFDLSFSLDAGFAKKPALDPDKVYDLLVVGSGPAGANAALYAARKGLLAGILGKRKGGQLLDTSGVENYLGVVDADGEGLAKRFLDHVARYEVPVADEADVVAYAPEGRLHRLTLATGESYRAKAVVVATGSTPRRLGVPGEERFAGKGVGYCAICDGPLFAGKDVFVAGGGNSAAQAALDLAALSRSVTIVQRSVLRADAVLAERLAAHPRIRVLLGTRIVEVLGDARMTGILVEDAATGERRTLAGDGLFVEIGHLPNAGAFASSVTLTESGEIRTDERMRTSVPGLFAAGDVTAFPYKQIVIAAGQGATAALAASEYIQRTDFGRD